MTTDQFLQAFASLGFPAVVALYLLVRLEPKIDSLIRSVDALTDALRSKNP